MTFGISEKIICHGYHDFDEIYVLPFIESTNIICFRNCSFMENGINRSCMILNIQPVTNIFTFSIHRKRLAMTDIVYKEGDQLLRELIWSIIVRAIGYYGRHAICIMICSDKMIRTCLARAVWTMWIIFCSFEKECVPICLMSRR